MYLKKYQNIKKKKLYIDLKHGGSSNRFRLDDDVIKQRMFRRNLKKQEKE